MSATNKEHGNYQTLQMEDQEAERVLKCVFVGDAAVGKTSLIVSYTTNGYPHQYVPTAFDNYSVVVKVDRKPIRLQLCDTAGQSSFDSLRPLTYPDTDVFILVYNCVDPCSFQSIVDHWLPEVSKCQPTAPIILVATQTDRRNDPGVVSSLWQSGSEPISTNRGKTLAQHLGCELFECSALTQHNLKQVFDSAILAGLEGRKLPAKPPKPVNHATKLKQGFQRFMNITRKLI